MVIIGTYLRHVRTRATATASEEKGILLARKTQVVVLLAVTAVNFVRTPLATVYAVIVYVDVFFGRRTV